jgi:hypothetical protein
MVLSMMICASLPVPYLAQIRTFSAAYDSLVLFSMRTEVITISPLVISAPRSVFAALSATAPAISISSPSSNSAASLRLNCCSSGTSAGVAPVVLELGLPEEDGASVVPRVSSRARRRLVDGQNTTCRQDNQYSVECSRESPH